MNNHPKFELTLFEVLLRSDLHPSKITSTLKKRTLNDLKSDIELNTCIVINELRNAICSPIKRNHLERYIHRHEQEVICMLNEVYAYIVSEGLKLGEDALKVYKLIKIGLKSILSYIENWLSEYFDKSRSVPHSLKLASDKELLEDKNVLLAKMRLREIDQDLVNLISGYITGHCEKSNCTYSEQYYVRQFTNSLLEILKCNKNKNWTRKVVVELIYLNFNKNSFFSWCRGAFAREVDTCKNITEQIDKFKWYLKEINPIAVKLDVSYKANRSEIKTLLNAYLSAELDYLCKWRNENTDKGVGNFKERAEYFKYKLPLNINVEQLALFVELFIRAKIFIIEKGKMMKTMEFFATHMSTIGAANISPQSLDNKRRADARTCAWMRDTLLVLLGKLDDLEGE